MPPGVLWGGPGSLGDQNPMVKRAEEQSRGELSPKLGH